MIKKIKILSTIIMVSSTPYWFWSFVTFDLTHTEEIAMMIRGFCFVLFAFICYGNFLFYILEKK